MKTIRSERQDASDNAPSALAPDAGSMGAREERMSHDNRAHGCDANDHRGRLVLSSRATALRTLLIAPTVLDIAQLLHASADCAKSRLCSSSIHLFVCSQTRFSKAWMDSAIRSTLLDIARARLLGECRWLLRPAVSLNWRSDRQAVEAALAAVRSTASVDTCAGPLRSSSTATCSGGSGMRKTEQVTCKTHIVC